MRRLKIGGLILLMLVLMLLPLWGRAQNAGSSDQVVMRHDVASTNVSIMRQDVAPTTFGIPVMAATRPKPAAESMVSADTASNELNSQIGVEATNSEDVEDTEGSAHISATVDKTVTLYLIPLLGLILFMIFKKSEQSAWMRLLYKLWDLAKDTDNVFAAGISSRHKSQVDLIGINAAKKQYTLEAANNLISPRDKALANKKAGGLSGALEVALTLFKSAAIIVPAAKQIFK